jgi:hypothetical protein
MPTFSGDFTRSVYMKCSGGEREERRGKRQKNLEEDLEGDERMGEATKRSNLGK